MRRFLLAAVAAAIALTAGCSTSTDPRRKPAELLELPRALTPDESWVSQASNQFAFALFSRLSESQPAANVFVSPLSVSLSLGMTMNGARGETLSEMRSTLGFGSAELEQINNGYRGLMSLQSGLDPTTTFQIANSVWYRQTFPFHTSFIDLVRDAFTADVRPSPFDASTVDSVNSWVKAKTAQRIPTILEAIKDDDVMFLINAIYFKGSWRDQFDPAQTRNHEFGALGGTQTVKMMNRDEGSAMRFGSTATATVGEIPYGNGAFVMTILLPRTAADINTLAASLDTASWRAAIASLADARHAVSLPRFKLEYDRQLASDLKALGMNTPFLEGGADFTGMSPVGRQLFISFVKHKTFVDVNEEGTEAAAVTNTGVGATSAKPCLCVDRPFVFAIRERFSGTILFVGKMVRIP